MLLWNLVEQNLMIGNTEAETSKNKPDTQISFLLVCTLSYINEVTELQGTVIYSFKDLKSATKSFSRDYKIGEGGFGDVYKGITNNGDVVAVAVKKHALTSNNAKSD
ncbi:hypothetical protein POM88_024223 [Heracleum sosnowskyi]|uniref:Uncharacterized protein n=1 Tax=Heracleum sosnowskyi TaxID=360622 RepID=A0AAD8MM40_9APIA|nr:hypothetical protein POM88_024223 [Heracleum sosnowskyi]